jgi:hypothetical protein
MAEKLEVVPFGKYKGKPLEALAQDSQYCEWLTQQDWFRARYPAIHTLIINYFGQPEETPEHNALQALFVDEVFQRRFVAHALGGLKNIKIVNVEFEVNGFDVLIRCADSPSGYNRREVYIECKPSVGDDYPAILRQMNSANKRSLGTKLALFIGVGGYVGTGATLEQVRAIFKSCEIAIVFEEEVRAMAVEAP